MPPAELIRSIYLGDRGCKAVLIDSSRNRVAIQVNVISRLRPGSDAWDFYTEADIADGWLVFTGATSVRLDPAGPIPNDFINDLSVAVIESTPTPRYRFTLSIGSVDMAGYTEVILQIEADGMHLEDPARPGVEIR